MDLKAASKEQVLASNNSSEEHEEINELKNMITELNEQREKDLSKIQVSNMNILILSFVYLLVLCFRS